MTETMTDWAHSWLLRASGLHRSRNGGHWEATGGHGYPVNDLIRQPRRLACAALWGLWEVDGGDSRWVQLHDETLTEVRAIAAAPGDPGVVTVSAYRLAFGRRGLHGATRWRHRSDGLSLNERFSDATRATARSRAVSGWARRTASSYTLRRTTACSAPI